MSGLGLVILLQLSTAGTQAAPKKKKADVYFGSNEHVDTVNRRVHMDVYNVNHSNKRKGKFTFAIAPDTDINIARPDGKMMRNMTIHNLADMQWIWVSSFDGRTTRGLTGSAYTSYFGTLVAMEGSVITLKLNERRIGARRYKISAKEEPRGFEVPAKVLLHYKGKPVDPSFVGVGDSLQVTKLEKGGVVLITVLRKPE